MNNPTHHRYDEYLSYRQPNQYRAWARWLVAICQASCGLTYSKSVIRTDVR